MNRTNDLLPVVTIDSRSKQGTRMLFAEDLSRIRYQELHEQARQQRLANRLAALRRWRWLANYAKQQADRLNEL